MSLFDMLQQVLADSGLGWLALDERQLVFMLATPVFIGVFAWEYLKIRHDPALVEGREALRNFALGAGYQTTELLFAGLIAFPVYAFAYHHRLLDIPLTLFTAALLWLLTDFCFYWMHRSSHRVRWLWAAHVTHHSSERMNFSTAMRQNATNIFNGGWLFYVPLALIGFNPVWIGVCYALSLVYQFFIHTTLVGRLHPAIEFVFNTPNHHRVHHARNADYVDTNYGGVFIVFDRLFGTFTCERADQPIEYGITRPPQHNNRLWMHWLHEYRDLARDMRKPGPLRQRLRHLWRPPEWQRGDD
ncbi:Sterol desaturase/sphingolipid hydroxylase, fatty acid hydroxylase superfamily [Halopseudomonas sabulinigri]|uniref:Sterol desaturase/sphingolipid hydroxylase, fatty acid hydroxylase superfamily n=1 Tax=Halopseudomonas sabulinigri TaxID=472181 RepID=A0A1H1W1M5_9GAMM|nr:sterol desaturase family protein [Halopseudomonas sabulinigri]SDS91178.1 Sterol desaturase/sphingolipid hydroxylase, fatty acid hydroxylase superfamily [Halopseudomonas sabulinigri]